MPEPALLMQMPRMRAFLRQPVGMTHGPAADHRVGDFRMELEAEGPLIAERLHLEFLAFGE